MAGMHQGMQQVARICLVVIVLMTGRISFVLAHHMQMGGAAAQLVQVSQRGEHRIGQHRQQQHRQRRQAQQQATAVAKQTEHRASS